MTLKTAEQASEAGYLLRGFRMLAENPAWQEIEKRIAKAAAEHGDGCRDRLLTPEKRAEHIEAAHLADELAGLREKRIAELLEALKRYGEQNAGGL